MKSLRKTILSEQVYNPLKDLLDKLIAFQPIVERGIETIGEFSFSATNDDKRDLDNAELSLYRARLELENVISTLREQVEK